MKKGWCPDKNYNMLTSAKTQEYRKLLAERIKKSEKPIYVITRQGIIEGEEWLKKYEEEKNI